MAIYNRYSPYKKTEQGWYLGTYNPIRLLPSEDDMIYVIPDKYHQQPWRLAKEIYGQERLYYVFALVNMGVLKDPLYDFKAGEVIRVPSKQRVERIVGGF